MKPTIENIRSILSNGDRNYDPIVKMGPEAFPLLREILHTGPDQLAAAAINVAAQIGGAGGEQFFHEASQNSSWRVRLATALFLRHLSTEAAVQVALRLLADPHEGVVMQTLRSCDYIDTENLQPLLEGISQSHPILYIRSYAHRFLKLPPPSGAAWVICGGS